MGARVIAPVIEFSSLDSAVFALSPPLNRLFHIHTIALLCEKLRCQLEHTIWNYIGCCKIRRSCLYPTRGCQSTARWSMSGRTIAVCHRDKRGKKEALFLSRTTNFTWGTFPRLMFFVYGSWTIPTLDNRRTALYDKSDWLIKVTEHYRDGVLVAVSVISRQLVARISILWRQSELPRSIVITCVLNE